MSIGDTIAVGLELDQRLGGAFDRGRDSDIVIPLREGNQARLFFPLKQIDGPLFGGAVDSAIGDLVSPGESVQVERRQREEASSCKKILFYVTDIFLHASFFVGRFHTAGRRVEEIVGREVDEAWIEVDTAVEAV